MKTRLDVLMVERGLAESREKAKAIIMSGNVFVDGQREDKAGASFPEKAVIEVKGSPLKYVSRGGLKLEKAMSHFDVELHDKVCMDVGSSTGGFTDCMLQNGAKKVFAVIVEEDKDPIAIIEEKGMKQNSDTGFLEQLAKDVLAQNEKSVTDYKNGKTNALGYLVGQCMKASKGKANPGIVKEIVTKMLNA